MKKGFICFAIVSITLFSSLVSYGRETIIIDKNGKERLTIPIEWCDKIGLRDVMLEMKETTVALTRALQYREWENVEKLSTKLKGQYDGIRLGDTNVPDDFWEFNDDFLRFFKRFQNASAEKNEEQADFQYKRVKTACHHCHIRYVRRKGPDEELALDRLYRDQFKHWGDGRSYPPTTK